MYDPSTRYEFRCFGQCFEAEERQLRAMTELDSITESSETYFIGPSLDLEHNVKIRSGKLELKLLIDDRDGLERWQPAGQWAFPVAADTVLELLLPDHDGSLKDTLPARLNRNELLGFAARPDIPLYRAEVFKRRFQFILSPCRAEVDQLLINGAAILSLAVESEDLNAVQHLQETLRIAGHENVSYPLALSRIMGMSAQSRVNGRA